MSIGYFDDEKREYADEVILTDDKHFIIPQIMKINNLLNN
jgi:hypothetical protein